MTTPSEKYHDLHPDRQALKSIKNERLAMTLQCIAVGSMLVLAMAKTSHVIKDLFSNTDRRGRSK